MLSDDFTPFAATAARDSGDFTPETLHASLRDSLIRLRRSRSDVILLHEAFAADAVPRTIEDRKSVV